MNKQEFLQRFQFSSLAPASSKYRFGSNVKSAAVLVPLTEVHGELQVVLTKRAEHLKHHPGQVSFPGGKVEDFDKSLQAAAIRETHEEIGVPPEFINIIGQLHPYQTISGYQIFPVVGFIDSQSSYIADKNEVSEIFHVPLRHFLNFNNHLSIEMKHKGHSHFVHFMPYQGYNIWGATAAMLKDLSLHLS